MAEKGFGVKEINLIGPSGTPTITSPNNLNLNAVNVAISTNVSIGGTLSVTGNVSVGGTLTYEDVTNIDSVGLITARSGLIISGVTTFNTGDVDFKGSGGTTKILFDASQDALEFADSATLAFGSHPGTGDYQINYVNGGDFAINAMSGGSQDLVIGRYESASQKKHLVSTRAGVIELYHDNSKKLETNSTGVNVTGAITVNGSALSIDPTDSDIQVAYTVTANGSSAYRFAGNGVVSTADNPDIFLTRGQKYRFINNSGGSHPFQIRVSSGGSAYSTGVTNNGAASGNIDFAPTFDSPEQLVYQCTSHGGMVGNIYIRGASGNTGTTLQRQFKYLTSTSQLTKGGAVSELNTNLRIPFTPKFADSNLLMEFDTSYVSPNSSNLYYCLFYDNTNSAGVSLPAAAGSRVRCHWTQRTRPFDANDNNHLSMRIVTPANNTNARTYTIHFGSEGAQAQFFVSTLSTGGGSTYPMTFTITEIAS